MTQEDLARRRELHAPRVPLEQRDAEILLEFLDLPAERGLRDVKLLGRFAE